MKKKINKKNVFAPLQRFEDKEHAKWFLIGSILVLIIWLASL